MIAATCEHHDKNALALLACASPRLSALVAALSRCRCRRRPSRRRAAGPRPDRAPEAAGGQRQPASARRQPAHARGRAGVGALAARARRSRRVRRIRPASSRGCGRSAATSSCSSSSARCRAARPTSLREQAAGAPRRRMGRAERARAAAAGAARATRCSRSSGGCSRSAAAMPTRSSARLRGVAGFQTAWLRANRRAGGGGGARHRHHRSSRPGRPRAAGLRLRQSDRRATPTTATAATPTPATRATGSARPTARQPGAVRRLRGREQLLARHHRSPAWSRPTTDNGAGGAGINWGGRVLPVRVAGKCGADVADIVDGMRWAAGLPVAGRAAPTRTRRASSTSASAAARPAAPAYQERDRRVARARRGGGGRGRQRMDRAVAAGQLQRRGRRRGAQPRRLQDQLLELRRPDRRQRHRHRRRRRQRSGAWGPVLADSGLVTLTNRRPAPCPASGGYARAVRHQLRRAAGGRHHRASCCSLNPALSYDADRARAARQRAAACDVAEDRRVLGQPTRAAASAPPPPAAPASSMPSRRCSMPAMPDSYVPPRRWPR